MRLLGVTRVETTVCSGYGVGLYARQLFTTREKSARRTVLHSWRPEGRYFTGPRCSVTRNVSIPGA